jgi:clusterin-associated protein 1
MPLWLPLVFRSARDLVAALKENIDAMKKQCRDLEADEKGLDAKIKRKQADLERHEKRLKSLSSVRPAFMDEYEKLEKDLVRHYDGYLERFRNLEYLEHELDVYHKDEQDKVDENDRSLKRMQKKLREEELRQLRGEMVGRSLAEEPLCRCFAMDATCVCVTRSPPIGRFSGRG